MKALAHVVLALGIFAFIQTPAPNDIWTKLDRPSGWILLGELQTLVLGGRQVGWGAWEDRRFRSIPTHTRDATKIFPSSGDHLLLKREARLFVASYKSGDRTRWSEFPVEGQHLWDSDSDTGFDLPMGAVVAVEEVKTWWAHAAGLVTVLARVAPTK